MNRLSTEDEQSPSEPVLHQQSYNGEVLQDENDTKSDSQFEQLKNDQSLQDADQTAPLSQNPYPLAQQQWVTKETYEAEEAARELDVARKTDRLYYGPQLHALLVIQGIIFSVIIVFTFTPLGAMLPTITKEGRYSPASPVIGILYALILILFLAQIIIFIMRWARRGFEFKKPNAGGWILIVLAIVATLFSGGFGLFLLPLIAISLVVCNFNPCAGT